MGKLVLFLVDGTTLDIPLERDRVTIGRRAGNDVCLPYPAVSGEHAVVVPVTAGAVIEDLGSTNGTFVNGKRVPRQFLHDGDQVDVGRQKLVYLADVNAVAKPPPREPDSHETGQSRIREPARAPEVADDPAPTESMPGEDAAGADRPADDSDSEPEPVAGSQPMLTVVTGPNAGRKLILVGDEVLLGRVGVQVAAVRRVDNELRLVAVEGADPPRVNGVPVPGDGTILRPGDRVELASTQLAFSAPDIPTLH